MSYYRLSFSKIDPRKNSVVRFRNSYSRKRIRIHAYAFINASRSGAYFCVFAFFFTKNTSKNGKNCTRSTHRSPTFLARMMCFSALTEMSRKYSRPKSLSFLAPRFLRLLSIFARQNHFAATQRISHSRGIKHAVVTAAKKLFGCVSVCGKRSYFSASYE